MTTTPTERRLAITQGNCKFTARNNDALISAGNKVVAEVGRADLEGWDQVMANATLYVDAHNTYNACGLTPSELMAKWKEATDLLSDLHEYGMQQAIYGRAFPEDIMQPLYRILSNLPQ